MIAPAAGPSASESQIDRPAVSSHLLARHGLINTSSKMPVKPFYSLEINFKALFIGIGVGLYSLSVDKQAWSGVGIGEEM